MAFELFVGVTLLVPVTITLLVLLTDRLFPKFFRSKLKKLLNGAVCGVGFLIPLALFTIGATTHDIWWDYMSVPLFTRFKTDLPSWYDSSVHSCQGEWTALGIGFMVIVLFSVLLFARFLVNWATTGQSNAIRENS
jgi:hypothetical protein